MEREQRNTRLAVILGVCLLAAGSLGLSPVGVSAAEAQSGALPYTCTIESPFGSFPPVQVDISGSATALATAEVGSVIDLTDIAVNVQFDPEDLRSTGPDDGMATLGPNASQVDLGETETDNDGLASYSGLSAQLPAAGTPGTTMPVTLDQVIHTVWLSPVDQILLGEYTCTPVGDAVVLAEVELTGQANFCEAPCSLDQIVEFDVAGAPLTMAQAGSNVDLETVTLDGGPQSAGGALNEVAVTNLRGDGASWTVTGQVSDFTVDQTAPACPPGDESTWSERCIPGDNLGWVPEASVGQDQVPGDVASVSAGSTLVEGLGGSAQTLCSAPATGSGGTFTCGAGLELVTSASTSASTYESTLTLTLA